MHTLLVKMSPSWFVSYVRISESAFSRSVPFVYSSAIVYSLYQSIYPFLLLKIGCFTNTLARFSPSCKSSYPNLCFLKAYARSVILMLRSFAASFNVLWNSPIGMVCSSIIFSACWNSLTFYSISFLSRDEQ